MIAEIIVEADDHRFTTDEWARYTGAQALAGGLGLLSVVFLGFGWWNVHQAMAAAILETPDGVLFVEGGAGPGLATGVLLTFVGVLILVFVPLAWPPARLYGEPVEAGDGDDR